MMREVREEREMMNLRRGETMRNIARQHQEAIENANGQGLTQSKLLGIKKQFRKDL